MSAEEKRTSEAPKKRRLWLKVFGLAALVLMVLVVLLPYLVPTGWLADRVEKALKTKVARPVVLGDVSWGWLSGVSVDDIEVGEAAEFGGGAFVKVERLSLHLSLLALLKKQVNIRSVTVIAPEVKIVRSQDGAWNFQTLLATGMSRAPVATASVLPLGQAGGVSIEIQKVRIKGGKAVYEDRMENVTFTASGLEAAVDADCSGPTITGSANLSFDLKQPGGDGKFELAAANLSVPKDTTRLAEDSAVTGTITLKGLDIAEVVAAASSAFGRDLVSGALTLSADYEVKGSNLTLKATDGSVKNLVVGKAALASGPVTLGDVDFSFDAAASQSDLTQSLSVKNLKLSTSFAEMTASADANVTADVKKVSGKASGTLDASALPPGLVDLPEDLDVSGPVQFEASFAGDPTPTSLTADIDAQAMKIAYGSTVKKDSGKAARISTSISILGKTISADRIAVTLSGGEMTASATFDSEARSASWKSALDLNGLDISDYYAGAKGLKANGKAASSGKFFLSTPKRKSAFDVEATLDKLSLDAVANPGVEAVVSGRLALNSARAQAKDTVVTIAGKPLTITALIQTPLERPTGKITARGKEISIDSAMAVLDALKSTVPPSAKPPAPEGGGKTTAEKAEDAGRLYVKNANVSLDVRVDKVLYQDYTGSDLVVDAGLVGGKAIVRKATMNIFGGQVDITANYDVANEEGPFDAALSVAKAQAGEPANKYLSKFLPGLGLSGTADVTLKAAGLANSPGRKVLDTLSGGGALDLLDGVVSLAGLPRALAAVTNVDTSKLKFSKLNIPLEFRDGALHYAYAVATGKDSVFVEGKTLLAGGYEQTIGLVPGGSSARIGLFTIKDGKVSFARPERLLADLAKARLAGAIGGESAREEKKSTEDQILEGVGGILDLLNKEKE